MLRTVGNGLAIALACGCIGCGGGGGGGGSTVSPPPVVVSQSPTFTSSASVSVRENYTDIVYRPVATDPQNDPLTYMAISGPDAARFTTNAVTREIRFAVPPDFEHPTDADGDNVYNIAFAASDGTHSTTHAVAVRVTDVKPGFAVQRVIGRGLYWTVTGYPDGSGRLVYADGIGQMIVRGSDNDAQVLGSFSDASLSKLDVEAINAIAFSPNFTVDRTVYVIVQPNIIGPGPFRLLKIQISESQPNLLNMSTADEIMRLPPVSYFMKFDSAGYLYVGTGSGLFVATSGASTITTDDPTAMLAQDPNSPFGKILRIDPSKDAFPNDPLRDYAIPASNPFASGGGMPEVYAMGVGRPHAADFDPASQSFIFSDRGAFEDSSGRLILRQELNRLTATSTHAINFGWPLVIGSSPKTVGMSYPGFVGPVAGYDDAVGIDLIGGVTYRGPIEEFQGYYFFGDNLGEKLWRIRTSALSSNSPATVASFEDVRSQFLPPTFSAAPDGPSVIASDTRGNLVVGGYRPLSGGMVSDDFYVVGPVD